MRWQDITIGSDYVTGARYCIGTRSRVLEMVESGLWKVLDIRPDGIAHGRPRVVRSADIHHLFAGSKLARHHAREAIRAHDMRRCVTRLRARGIPAVFRWVIRGWRGQWSAELVIAPDAMVRALRAEDSEPWPDCQVRDGHFTHEDREHVYDVPMDGRR